MTTQRLKGILDRLDGRVLMQGDDGYDAARTVWNAMVDRRPRLIVQCTTVEDVATAVLAARELDLEIGVRCGGHSIVGHAVPDDGLMIDLTPMSAVRVDPQARRAWVQGGALLGALDVATQRHGLATTAGNVSHTGVGGLTLGGGMGWLARKHGLTCDNVESFEVVTAEGAVVRAAADDNPDLFWGLRGGGGNFGIVTDFEFRLHDTGTVSFVAELDFSAEQAGTAVRAWRDLSATAPREATFAATIFAGIATLGFVWVGEPERALALVPALGELGQPVAERVGPMSYLDLQRREDTIEGHALRRYWKGHYFTELTDDAIDALLEHGVGRHGVAASVQAYGGAIGEVPSDESAFARRSTAFEYVAAAKWTDPLEDEAIMTAARRLAGGLAPYATGAYVNALTDDGDGVRRAYGDEALARLRDLKRVWDPDNVFHLNQNIAPAL
jgi:FAD/FMN-containing dehydrogenase